MFHRALVLCRGVETCLDCLLDGELHVGSPKCHEDEFLRRLCESWSNRDHPEELLTPAPSLSSVYQDRLLEALACLDDLKTWNVDCVAFMAQHHHVS